MLQKTTQAEQIKSAVQSTHGMQSDLISQTLDLDEFNIELIYLRIICDDKRIQTELIKPFFEINNQKRFFSYLSSLSGYKKFQNQPEALNDLLFGYVIILVNGSVHLVHLKKIENQEILDSQIETTIMGPQKAMSENLDINLNLIRNRYHNSNLKLDAFTSLGKKTKLKLMLLYDSEEVDQNVLQKIKEDLNKIDKDIVQSAGDLHRTLTRGTRRLFPELLITERPDRIVFNLSKGKVVIMLEGSPFVLVAPAVFFDFMSSMEDLYQSYMVSKFIILLRYLGLMVSLILPAGYVAITAFNPEVFRVQLALSIAGSRVAVPYPAYIEVLFMLLILEMLVEASIRLPKTIGTTATTVGGLILGQAATEAGLVSTIMIIIVSSVAISNFVIPVNEMTFAIRVTKYFLILLATLAGLTGLIVGILGLIYYLVFLDSYGQPYLKIFLGETKEQKTPKEVGSN